MNRPSELKGCSRNYVSGIYQIKNLLTGKFYIGSSNHLYRRYSDHVRELQRGTHSNPKLQNSWNKFGKENFGFFILEFCLPEYLFELEQKYINELNPFFNIAKEVGIPNTPKAGSIEAKQRYQKTKESIQNSEWCNSKEFHTMLSEKMIDRWKNTIYKENRSKDTKSLWNNDTYKEKQKHAHRKVNSVEREYIRKLKEMGYKIKDLSKRFNVNETTIGRILQGLY